jgi:hypothetical protein
MAANRILPILLDTEGGASEKLLKFFKANSADHQLESIKLWSWRSEIDQNELREPLIVQTEGVITQDKLTELLTTINSQHVSDVVFCAVNVMKRAGLDQTFTNKLAESGITLYTSESVNPVPEDEFHSVAI